MRTINAVFMLALLAVSILLVVSSASRSSAYSRADRFSMRVQLPYGSEATRDSVARRSRVSARATALAQLATTVAVAPLLLTPIAGFAVFPFIVVLLSLTITGFASAVVNVRERMFHPAPDAPRVARVRALGTADYLDRFRLLLPWALAVAATGALIALAVRWFDDPSRVDAEFALSALFAATIGVAVYVGFPAVERHLLARAQPASDTLELAWDDAFRATTLSTIRLSASLTAWLACSLALGALWIGDDAPFSTFASQFPTWGVLALTLAYPSTGRPLRADLYPDWLRRPAAVGGAA